MALDPYRGKIRCPQCSYPLLGLPPVHSCPECGLNYDPYSRLYIVDRGRSIKYALLIGGFLNVIAFVLLLRAGLQLIPALIPSALALVSVVTASRNTAKRVYIDRSGIRFEHRSHPVLFIPWTQFGKARFVWAGGPIRIYDRQGRTIPSCFKYQVRPYLLARSCVAKMNELAAIYASVDLTPEALDPGTPEHQPQK